LPFGVYRRTRRISAARPPAVVVLAATIAALAARQAGHMKSSSSGLPVLIVVAPPHAVLVPPLRRPIEPLIHAPETVHSARIGRIGVVHRAIFERERAHSRPLADVRRIVGSRHGGAFRDRRVPATLERPLAPIVVLESTRALLRLGKVHVEIGIEVA